MQTGGNRGLRLKNVVFPDPLYGPGHPWLRDPVLTKESGSGLNRILFPGPVKFSIAQKVFISGTVHIRVINYI